MPEYKYALVRFFPDAVRDEPINVGVVLHSAANEYLGYRFDLRRASNKMNRADRDTFRHYEEELEPIENEDIDWNAARFESFAVSDANFLGTLSDTIGNRIRFGSPRGLVAEDPDETLEELFSRYVSTGVLSAGPRITKGTIVRDIKMAFAGRGVGEYIKTRPVVIGRHRNYTLPLGIRHSHRTFIEALKLRSGTDSNYRSMAAVAKLWDDARNLQQNRHADLCVVLHYTGDRVPEGERLLQDDNVRVFHRAPQVLGMIDVERVRTWDQ
jgi:Protein of unknown function (DUF3037)